MHQRHRPLTLRFAVLLLGVLLCPGQAKSLAEQKDLDSFSLPEAVKKAAPEMQGQLLELLPINSPQQAYKPDFAFLENGQLTRGRSRSGIQRLNLLHVACYRKGKYVWGGSLMFALGQGATVFSRTNQMIGVGYQGEGYQVEFRDGADKLSIRLPYDDDHVEWAEAGELRAYFYYYVFPQSLYDPSKRGPAKPITAINAPAAKGGWADQAPAGKPKTTAPKEKPKGPRTPWDPSMRDQPPAAPPKGGTGSQSDKPKTQEPAKPEESKDDRKN